MHHNCWRRMRWCCLLGWHFLRGFCPAEKDETSNLHSLPTFSHSHQDPPIQHVYPPKKNMKGKKKRPQAFSQKKQRVLSSNNQKNGIHSLKVDVFVNVDGDIHKCEPSVPRQFDSNDQWNSQKISGYLWSSWETTQLYRDYIITHEISGSRNIIQSGVQWNVISHRPHRSWTLLFHGWLRYGSMGMSWTWTKYIAWSPQILVKSKPIPWNMPCHGIQVYRNYYTLLPQRYSGEQTHCNRYMDYEWRSMSYWKGVTQTSSVTVCYSSFPRLV